MNDVKLIPGRRRGWLTACGCAALAAVLSAGVMDTSDAAITSNVKNTRHNLSTSNIFSGTPVKAQTETEICVFCHTPHAANTAVKPLWNRSTNTSGTYTKYTSSSLDATTVRDVLNGVTGGSSILCLSCHDGTIALGNIMVLRGSALNTASGNQDVLLDNTAGTAGTAGATMPTGSGSTTGYTRLLGTNLTNDHPISITYDDGLATADGELQHLTTTDPKQRDTIDGTIIGIRASGYKPHLPLEPTGTSGDGQVQCATCHDPHITEEKFLRLNRTQKNQAPSGSFSAANDIICLACHTKLGDTWAQSAHAKVTVANEAYLNAAATKREFATGTKVWEAACLNCHDTHTVQGARRLLREGTDATPATALYLGGFKAGGNSAIEETCYQCHAPVTNSSILSLSALTASEGVPDIKTEFSRARRMPIVSASQGGGTAGTTEKHDITSADFIETATLLGAGATGNRHVECTDCHNPHRVIKNELFNGQGSIGQRTHVAGGTAANLGADGNVASGVLRGIWGVEPTYDVPNAWPEADVSMTVKFGDPGNSTSTARSSTYLTREYQLCFKCHSDYANSTTASSFPSLGTTGLTPNPTNGMTKYTNVAGEMSYLATDPPTSNTDQGEYGEGTFATPEDGTAVNPAGSYPADTDPGAAMTDIAGTQNHRSWHPVRMPTGRTRDERRMQATGGNFLAPFDTYVGTQTMHCSDCHGADASWTVSTGPNLTKVQGPHGSDNNFLLRSGSDTTAPNNVWSTSTTISNGSTQFCYNCHNPTVSGSGRGDGTARVSGFTNSDISGCSAGGGHGNAHNGKACMRCHVAVPHGWKNKALLVNLNCVGSEGGQASECTTVSGAGISNTNAVTMAPYYISSYLRIAVWQASGNWGDSHCGVASGGMKSPGKDWMTDGGTC